MAATNAEKFIIELQARYTGNKDVDRLQKELDKLGQVENLQKWQAKLKESAAAMKQAGTEAARLRTLVNSSYDEKVLANLRKAEAALGKLQSGYSKQQAALARCKKEMDSARAAQEAYAKSLSATPTDEEAAHLAELTAALVKAENAWAKQQDSLKATRKAYEETRHKIDTLKEALRNSVDPKLKQQYEEQVRLHQRHAKEVERLKGQLAETGKAVKALGVDTKNLTGEQQRLDESTRQSGQHLAALRTLGIQSFAGIEDRVKRLKAAYDQLGKSNRGLREQFAHWVQYRQRIAEAREQTNSWTKSVQKLQSGWAGMLGVLGQLSIAKSAVREFATFESSMLRVQALSRATGADFAALEKQAKRLGATTRYTAAEAADGMSQLAAAGLKAEQIYKVIPGVLHAAAAGGMEVGDTADKVTNIMSQFGLQADQAVHVADVLTVGFTGAATTMQELSDAMVYCGPVAHALGYSLEETTSILQALANAGYKGEKAGTALRGGFTRLIRPMRMGREVLEKYGIQVLDADGNMRKFTDIMDDLAKTGMSTAESIKLFGQEAGPGMISLLSQGSDSIRAYEAEMAKADGRAEQIAEHMESGVEGAFRRLAAAISAVAIAFGDTFAPAIHLVAGTLTTFATQISELPGPVKGFVGVLAGGATAFAVWKLGLGTVCMMLVQLGLDLAAASVRVWAYATRTLPMYVATQNLATASTSAFRLVLNKVALDLPLVGKLLSARVGELALFRGAASKAAAAARLLGAAFALWAAWDLGKMVGEWLNQFALVRKAVLSLVYAVDMLIKAWQMLWNVMRFKGWQSSVQEMKNATQGYLEALKDIDAEVAAQAEKKRKAKEREKELERQLEAGNETGENSENSNKKAKKNQSTQEKLDAVLGSTGEDEDEEDEDGEEDEDEDEGTASPAKPRQTRQPKPKRRPDSDGAGQEQEPADKPLWQQMLDEQINLGKTRAEANEKADAERRGTVARVHDPLTGKWTYSYGQHEDTEERDGKLYAKTPKLEGDRIVRQDNGWAQLFEGDKFVRALSAAEAEAMERRLSAWQQGENRIARAAPELSASRPDRRRAINEERTPPSKVIELRLGSARLSGNERDVEDFISQLERAGLTA